MNQPAAYHRVLRWTIRAALLAGLMACLPATAAAAHRVALNDFTTDENTWQGNTAAADTAPALQAELTKEPNVEWVERAQLDLVQKELELGAALSDGNLPGAVRRARLSKADWLVTGRLLRKENARELRLEVIDLVHADILAERAVALPLAADAPLRLAPGLLQAMAGGLRAALREAEERERQVAGLPCVAVLFFPDSEVFQREFANTLADPKIAGGRLRVLRFPRAGEALGEAELVLGGFAEDAEGAWRGIADCYVWGSLVRHDSEQVVDGERITDDHTPTIALTVWDGSDAPARLAEEGAPTPRRQFDEAVAARARRLAAGVAATLRAQQPHAAEQLEKRKSSAEGYLHEPAGRRHFFDLTQTLEAACFFDPKNRAAAEMLVRLRWDRNVVGQVRNKFQFWIGRSEAWGRFVERFGFPETASKGQPVSREFLGAACEAVDYATYGNREEFGYPGGVPERAAAQWASDLVSEVGRRTMLVAGRQEADPYAGLAKVFANLGQGAFYLADPHKRLEVLEKVWPLLPARWQTVVAHGGLRPEIIWTFEDLGRPGDEEKLFATATPLPPPTMSAEDERRFREMQARGPQGPEKNNAAKTSPPPATAASMPELNPQMEKFNVWEKARLTHVYDMTPLAGRIWLIGEGLEETVIAGPNRALTEQLRPTRIETTRLFSFDPATGALDRVAATREFKPVSIFAHDGKLWLALGRDGAATLDPATGALRRFGPEDGLDAASAYRFAVAGGHIFLTTNLRDGCEWDPATNRWSAWDTKFPDYQNGYGGEVRRLCGFGSHLLLYQKALAVCDVGASGWTRYDERLGSAAGGFLGVSCVTTDAHGFWFGGSAGLYFLDPATGATVSRLYPQNGGMSAHRSSAREVFDAFLKRRTLLEAVHDPAAEAMPPLWPTSRIPGPVMSLASDGDFLWVAVFTNTKDAVYQTQVLLLHKPSGRWVGRFISDGATSLAVDDRYLWLGCNRSYKNTNQCLQRVKKRAFYDLPPEGWVPDNVPDAGTHAIYDQITRPEQALWNFTCGDYAEAARMLPLIEPQTNETLFLQGLCYDPHALNQPDKARAFFEQIVAKAFPRDPVCVAAHKQLATLAPATSAGPPPK